MQVTGLAINKARCHGRVAGGNVGGGGDDGGVFVLVAWWWYLWQW